MRTVLAILAAGFEEIEAVTPIDLLRRAGASVTIASLDEDRLVVGRNGLTITAEAPFRGICDGQEKFDCLLLPGGPGTKNLRASVPLREMLRAHHAAGRLIAAICAAPAVLHDAGLLEGRRYTAHPSVARELPAVLGAEKVVRDGNLLTSRGAGTALEFGFALVEMLFSPETCREIALAIAA